MSSTQQLTTESKDYILDDVQSTWKQYPELLFPVPKDDGEKDDNENYDNNFSLFKQTIKVAFDINFKNSDGLIYHLVDRDLVWRPEIKSSLNYYQWVSSMDTLEREPMLSTWSYLFDKSEPYYHEPYMRDDEEKELLKEFYVYIKKKYRNGKDYFRRVNMMLFNEDDDTYSYYIDKIDKKIFT
jgi:hypothetical protein